MTEIAARNPSGAIGCVDICCAGRYVNLTKQLDRFAANKVAAVATKVRAKCFAPVF